MIMVRRLVRRIHVFLLTYLVVWIPNGFGQAPSIVASAAQNIEEVIRELHIDSSLVPPIRMTSDGQTFSGGEAYRQELETFRITLEERRLMAEAYRSAGVLLPENYRQFINSYRSWIDEYRLRIDTYKNLYAYPIQAEPTTLASLSSTANNDEVHSALQSDVALIKRQFFLELSGLSPISVPPTAVGNAYYPAGDVSDVLSRQRSQLLSVLEEEELYGLHGYVVEEFPSFSESDIVEPSWSVQGRAYDARTIRGTNDSLELVFGALVASNSLTMDVTVNSTPSGVRYRIEYVNGMVQYESLTNSSVSNLPRGRYYIEFENPPWRQSFETVRDERPVLDCQLEPAFSVGCVRKEHR